ncbi:hypothetical protein GRF29_77g1471502 [Pseudopithomyces chartarum]|uniref:Pantothenate transporter liz1 n=1 Tax=Pseudopithomyces chartarum TaxID=1892770 RepID=A0AAN6LWP2_9PLEO|nr:hypothetical protein GRF29_77g1471502 [Pseudopithomyces chartarum]
MTTQRPPSESSVPSQSWKGWIWDSTDVPKEERRFLLKLDATLLTFGTLGMLIKWIDTSNITNAFVSGMKEDLNLYGNQYNYIIVSWTVGSQVGWTVFTFALAGELGKRNGIMQSAVSIAPIFSGFLQAGIYNGLNGHAGLAGWRWLFVINGVISFPIAVLAYFFLPDTPGTAKPNWIFTEQDIKIARARMEKAGRKPEGKPYTVKSVTGFLTSWKTLLFTLIFTIQPFGSQPFTAFVFWLKAHNKKGKPPVYSIAQINEYPTLGNAFTAVYSLVCVWISDGPLRGRRWPVILFSNFIAIIIFTLLAVTPVMGPFSHRAPLYILSSIGGSMVPLTMAWMAELISENAEQRAFTAASMNTLQFTFSAWIPLVWFQQVKQPFVTSGNRAAAVVAGLNIIIFSSIAFLARNEKLAKKRDGASIDELAEPELHQHMGEKKVGVDVRAL